MQIKLNDDKEAFAALVELIKLTTKKGEKGAQAREMFAKIVGPKIQQVFDEEGTHRAFYTKQRYALGEPAEVPLDQFDGNGEGLIDVWATSIAGGLPTNHISGEDVFRLTTERYDSAWSALKRFLESGNVDHVMQGMNRMIQEVLVKEKYAAMSVMFAALAEARTNGQAHIIDAGTANVLAPQDINRLATRIKRLRSAFAGGTAKTGARGITHMIVSPEIMESLANLAYEPVNTRNGVVTTSGAVGIALPDQIRAAIWENGGLKKIPGVGTFIEMNEMGVDQAYSQMFDGFYTAGVGDPEFDVSVDEIAVGVDLSIPAGVQVSATDSDRTTEVFIDEDDQWVKRSKKAGWYLETETGFGWFDNKTLSGVIV